MSGTPSAEACPEAFAEVAGQAAEAAAAVLMGRFRSSFAIEDKSDRSPVTEADRDAEAAMRAVIEGAFPDHGILGEELGPVRPEAEHVWVLDPIDGTQSFVTGKPLFGVLVALLRRGTPIVGVIECPALGERWLGAAGRPCTFNGRAARVRACAGIEHAWLDATSPQMFPEDDFRAFEVLRTQVRRTVWGTECCGYGYLASGHVDLVVEATMQPYDYCALVPVVEGAGGVITDWAGRPLTLESDGRVLAAGDARMHAAAVEILTGARGP